MSGGAHPAPRTAHARPVPEHPAGGRSAARGVQITLPKVSTASQVEAMVDVCAAYEAAADLSPGRLTFEIQVETPPLILSAEGRTEIALALHAGDGRVTSLHYGTYDYSASLGVSAAYQSLAHPAADYAKEVMQPLSREPGCICQTDPPTSSRWGQPTKCATPGDCTSPVRRSLERAYYQGGTCTSALTDSLCGQLRVLPGRLPPSRRASVGIPVQVGIRGAGRAGHRAGAGSLPPPRLQLRALDDAELRAAVPLPLTSWQNYPDPSPIRTTLLSGPAEASSPRPWRRPKRAYASGNRRKE